MLRYHGCFEANHKLRARLVQASPPEQRTAPAFKPNKARPGRIDDSVAAATPASTRASEKPSPDTSAASSLRRRADRHQPTHRLGVPSETCLSDRRAAL